MDNSSGPVLLLTLLLLQNTSSPKASSPPAGYEMAEPPAPCTGPSRNHSLVEYGLRPGEITAASVVWGVLWLISVLGNFLVCLVIHRSRRTQSTTNYFVVSMACADLVSSVGSAPFLLLQLSSGRWMLGSGVCRLVRYIQYLTPGVQTYVLLAISVDRCYTLIHPMNFRVSREKAKRMTLVSWLCGALFASPACFLYGSSSDHHCNFFLPSSWLGAVSGVIQLSVLLLLIPSLLIILCYRKLFTYIWRSGTEYTAGRRTVNLVLRRKVKTVKMFFIFVLNFLLSWLPFFMVQLWHPQETDYRKSSLLFLAITWISFSSSASKPTLFYIYNANFRRGMQEICCMWKYPRSNIYTITTSSRTAENNHIIPAQPHQRLHCDAFSREVKEHELSRPGESNPTNIFAKRVSLL
ncbi:probable G-protein coupled receptor 19 [Onychostruthus taczanowskii]|uniref:probable G-protein coupled receptor 19 n=1 Tax=Onychostruthus taczanowskii TaxID=356909 RepID=UPI001B8079AC|nr:probable G-protein coupled receptor 19 [Onychostruthus taczanowskii]